MNEFICPTCSNDTGKWTWDPDHNCWYFVCDDCGSCWTEKDTDGIPAREETDHD